MGGAKQPVDLFAANIAVKTPGGGPHDQQRQQRIEKASLGKVQVIPVLEVVDRGGKNFHAWMRAAEGRGLDVKEAGRGGTDQHNLARELILGPLLHFARHVVEDVAERQIAIGERLAAPVQQHRGFGWRRPAEFARDTQWQ